MWAIQLLFFLLNKTLSEIAPGKLITSIGILRYRDCLMIKIYSVVSVQNVKRNDMALVVQAYLPRSEQRRGIYKLYKASSIKFCMVVMEKGPEKAGVLGSEFSLLDFTHQLP